LFRAAIAPMAAGAPFFESVAVSGSHWNSARMVACGWVDVAAVDCVTFAHLRRCDPALVAKLRMLDWTPASPSLPYITAKATDDATLQALRDAMAGASVDSRLTTVCKSLFLVGFDFEPDRSLSAIREHEQRAAGLGYPVLI
jgi:ABC-type phosphate/phosphonate transport system substrate-binding protein